MKFLEIDSPFMTVLGKLADLMWLNILTMVFCIPIVTAGASLTAMHYVALKMVRNEECYITRGFWKAFKENFRQATVIWLILMVVVGVLAGDFYVIYKTETELNQVLKMGILLIGILVLYTGVMVFPVLAKFKNTIKGTIRNALFISVAQFPKTILMIVLHIVPFVILYLSPDIFPVFFMFWLTAPAFGGAWLYNGFFKKLEKQILEQQEPDENAVLEEDERIFKDELDESLFGSDAK